MRTGPWLAVWVVGGSALCAEPGGGTPGPISGVLRIPIAERVRSLDPALADFEADRTATGLSAPDALTLELRLTAPAPDQVWALTVPALGVIPPEAVAAYGPRLGQHPVGTGPFRLAGSASAEPLVLEANPTFREVRVPDHAPTALRGRRLPLCARVEIAAVTEPRRLVDDLLAGRLERSWIPRGESTQLLDPAGGDLLSALRARGLRLEKVPRLEVIYDAFNFDDPVVGAKAGAKGRAIRRAMSLAVDLQAARTNLYDGRVTLVQPWVSGAVPRDLGTAPWASIAVEGAPPAPGSAPR